MSLIVKIDNIDIPIKIIQSIRENVYIGATEKDLLIVILFKNIDINWDIVCTFDLQRKYNFKCQDFKIVDIISRNFNEQTSIQTYKSNIELFSKEFKSPDISELFLLLMKLDFTEEQKNKLTSLMKSLEKFSDGVEYNSIKTFELVDEIKNYLEVRTNFSNLFDYTHNQSPFIYLWLTNLYNYQIIGTDTLSTFESIMSKFPSISYIEQQNQFINQLTEREKNVLKLYSRNGDTVLNWFLRNQITKLNYTIVIKYIIDRFDNFTSYFNDISLDHNLDYNKLMSFLFTFHYDLKNLFSKAPINDKEFIVYRGIRTKDHFNGTVDNIYIDKGYISTTLDVFLALKFSQYNGYINIIHLPVGLRCIFNRINLFSEFEVMLNDQTTYIVTKDFQKHNFLPEYFNEEDIQKNVKEHETNELLVLVN